MNESFSSTIKCQACGSDNPAGMRFCGMCGSLLEKRAPIVPAKANQSAKPSPVFVLRYGRKNELRQMIELWKGEYVIGRLAGCHIQLDDPLVSRHHANLAVGQDAVWIMDLESTNGTRINKVKLTPNQRYRLQPGDVFEITSYVFELNLAPGSLPPTPPPASRKEAAPAFTELAMPAEEEGRDSSLAPTSRPAGVLKPPHPAPDSGAKDTSEKPKIEGEEESGSLVCSLCQGGNPMDAVICIYCGAVVKPDGIDCPACGLHSPAGDLFCERCGEKFSASLT